MGENCELQTTWVYNFPRIKILAITFSSTIDRAVHKCWAQMTGRVKAQAKQAYGRDLCLAQRVPYVEVSLLATMWYTAKNLPRPDDVYIAFDNHNSMVHLARSDVQDTLDVTENQAAGCWAILGVVVKCRVLLLRRMCVQVRKEALQRQRA